MAEDNAYDITFVVAAGENGVIGASGVMPDWKLRDDEAHFKQVTLDRPVIMGRKTLESMGSRPLPRRRNIVISRRPGYTAPGCEVANSVEAAIELAKSSGPGEIHIIGGGEIFAAAMPYATKLYFTLVHARPSGEAKFHFNKTDWHEDWREDHQQDDRNTHTFTYINYTHI